MKPSTLYKGVCMSNSMGSKCIRN